MSVDIEKLKALIEQGKSAKEIAVIFNVNAVTIYKHLKAANISYVSEKEKIRQVHQQIVEDFNSSLVSLQDLADKYNCSRSNICLILKKFGIRVPTERKNQIRAATCLEKYGTKNVMYVPEIQKQRGDYFLENYGSTSPFGCSEVLARAKETLKKNYGVDNPLKSKKVQEKVRATNMELYGGPAPACSEAVVAKMSQTYLEKTGYSNAAHNPEVKQKKINTNLRIRGVEHHMHDPEVRKKLKRVQIKSGKIGLYKVDGVFYTSSEIRAKYGLAIGAIIKRSRELSAVNFKLWLEGKYRSRVSRIENAIRSYVSLIYPADILQQVKFSNKEGDIYLPNKNLIIEVNGDYWHSDEHKPTNYHKEKKDLFDSLGLDSIFISESDWYSSTEKIKNLLRAKIEKLETIGARKCVCKLVAKKEAKEFLDSYHLQNSTNNKIALGLYYGEQLIQVATFGKPRFNKNYEWELLRFCSKPDIRILGGLSKLLNYFKSLYNPTNLITYCDRDISNGYGYIKAGFREIGTTAPNFFYTKNYRKVNSLDLTRKKLAKLLKSFNHRSSIRTNMRKNGFLKVYTCGNKVLEFIF